MNDAVRPRAGRVAGRARRNGDADDVRTASTTPTGWPWPPATPSSARRGRLPRRRHEAPRQTTVPGRDRETARPGPATCACCWQATSSLRRLRTAMDSDIMLQPPPDDPLAAARLGPASRRMLTTLLAVRRRPAGAAAAALPRQGQARHLHLHERRRVAHGHVRPQAEARRVPARRQDAPKGRQGARLRSWAVQAARASAAPRSATCSRTSAKCMDDICAHPLDARRPQRPLPGDPRHPHRLGHLHAARASARGSATGWARRTRTCRPSSCSRPTLPYAGSQVWSSDFLPGVLSRARASRRGPEPVPDLEPPRGQPPSCRRWSSACSTRFNRKHQQRHPGDPLLAARIKSFETAFGMQMAMPQVLDLSKETDATLELYGLERGSTKGFGWQCLVARRLAERACASSS